MAWCVCDMGMRVDEACIGLSSRVIAEPMHHFTDHRIHRSIASPPAHAHMHVSLVMARPCDGAARVVMDVARVNHRM